MNELKPIQDLLKDEVLVLNLGELQSADERNALATIFLNKYYEYMFNLTKHDFVKVGEGTDTLTIRKLNSYLLVDEANGIMQYKFPMLKDLLIGREFGRRNPFPQYLSHFKPPQENYTEPLLTWVYTKSPT